jgi:hypothetical protein
MKFQNQDECCGGVLDSSLSQRASECAQRLPHLCGGDPCRLVRRVKEIGWLDIVSERTPSTPAGLSGR